MIKAFIAAAAGLLSLAAGPGEIPGGLRDGDLVFQESASLQSLAIHVVTGSRLSHMGIAFRYKHADGRMEWAVIEAVGPVRMVPFDAWRAHGVGGAVAIRRLPGLTEAEAGSVVAAARRHLGKSYDFLFRWDDQQIYCSELVYDAFREATGREIGTPAPLGTLDLSSPAARALFERRLGFGLDDPRAKPILDEPVITPAAIYRDPALVTVRDELGAD